MKSPYNYLHACQNTYPHCAVSAATNNLLAVILKATNTFLRPPHHCSHQCKSVSNDMHTSMLFNSVNSTLPGAASLCIAALHGSSVWLYITYNYVYCMVKAITHLKILPDNTVLQTCSGHRVYSVHISSDNLYRLASHTLYVDGGLWPHLDRSYTSAHCLVPLGKCMESWNPFLAVLIF